MSIKLVLTPGRSLECKRRTCKLVKVFVDETTFCWRFFIALNGNFGWIDEQVVEKSCGNSRQREISEKSSPPTPPPHLIQLPNQLTINCKTAEH
jgi:hypothetical protein